MIGCVCACMRALVFVLMPVHLGMFVSQSCITSSLAEISHNHISHSPRSCATSINVGQN